jgi:LL-diaminopimelate aminotransferase
VITPDLQHHASNPITVNDYMISPATRIQQVEEYYFSKKLAEVRSLDSAELPIINLGIGSPDLAPTQSVLHQLAASAQNPANHGYQNYKGVPAFRQAIADFNTRVYATSLNPETEILPLMGSKEGIMHISMAFVNQGDEVLIPNPGYPTYSSVANLVGAKIIPYDLKEETGWRIDIDALRKRDLSKVKVMWVNYPHMPTGTTASVDELQQLVALAKQHSFLLVNDNPYSLILNNQPFSILSLPGAAEVALELNSLSKSHNMAGWRLGWVAGNSVYIDAVLRVKSNMDSGMFLPLQHAAIEALKNNNEWFNELNATYNERKHVAQKIMQTLGCTYATHQSGLFLWAKVANGVADVEKWIDEILYETKVFITPGFIFGSNGQRFIRLSLCAPVEKLALALKRIEDWQEMKKSPSTKSTAVA